LQAIGVLQLIHDDLIETGAGGFADEVVRLQEFDRLFLKVGEVERGLIALLSSISAVEARDGLPKEMDKIGVPGFDPLRAECGKNLVFEAFSVVLAGCSNASGVSFGACCNREMFLCES
jgi:hypothetical protein